MMLRHDGQTGSVHLVPALGRVPGGDGLKELAGWLAPVGTLLDQRLERGRVELLQLQRKWIVLWVEGRWKQGEGNIGWWVSSHDAIGLGGGV